MAVTDGDVMRCTVSITLPNAVVAQNVYYYQLDDEFGVAPSNAAIGAAIDTQLTNLYQAIEAVMVTGAEATHVEIDKIVWDGAGWETVENLDQRLIGVSGTEVTDMVPHGVAPVITAGTSRPQTRARKFIAGVAEDLMTDSDLGGTALAALADFAAEWISSYVVSGTADIVPVVVGQSGASAGLVYLLINWVVRSIVGYQRRRKPGVGS